LTLAPFFHVGILVHDLGEAIDRYADVLGITFVDPAVARAELQEPWREETIDLRVAYSNQGPPYIELLEAQGDGLYSIHQGEGMHHLGVWESDCEGRLEELTTRKGMRTEAVQFTPERTIIVAYFYPGHLHGTRLEIVDEGRRPMMEDWITGGEFVP
jgi:catechol 2,3-dioxygenase-like lactoylglutathione lyase family enzyme